MFRTRFFYGVLRTPYGAQGTVLRTLYTLYIMLLGVLFKNPDWGGLGINIDEALLIIDHWGIAIPLRCRPAVVDPGAVELGRRSINYSVYTYYGTGEDRVCYKVQLYVSTEYICLYER